MELVGIAELVYRDYEQPRPLYTGGREIQYATTYVVHNWKCMLFGVLDSPVNNLQFSIIINTARCTIYSLSCF